MGFGHRIYKSYDSRVSTCREICKELFKVTGKDPLIDLAVQLESIALKDEYFKQRKLYPNIDFYSGLVYRAMGFAPDFYTVIFAVGRIVGWLAHWKEAIKDPEMKIVRPRSNYIGH